MVPVPKSFRKYESSTTGKLVTQESAQGDHPIYYTGSLWGLNRWCAPIWSDLTNYVQFSKPSTVLSAGHSISTETGGDLNQRRDLYLMQCALNIPYSGA